MSLAVEIYNLSNSVSMITSQEPTPDKDKTNMQDERDKEMQQQSWVEKEIARLEQQNIALKKKNDAQGQIILAYSKEKQAKPQQPPTIAQLDNEKGEDKLFTSHDPWPAGGVKMHKYDQLQPRPQHDNVQTLEYDH